MAGFCSTTNTITFCYEYVIKLKCSILTTLVTHKDVEQSVVGKVMIVEKKERCHALHNFNRGCTHLAHLKVGRSKNDA